VIDVGLDVAYGAAQRLCNQQAERSQFHARGPEAPETIAGIGDDRFRAYWVGALRQLYATRTGRFLTLRYVPGDGSTRRARANSIRLAKLAFARTRDVRPAPGKPPQATC
jgi:hypothetical protein